MPDLTLTEALGTGISWTQHWDVDTQAGSIGTASGLDNLRKDLGWSLLRAAREEDLRGRRFSPELREDTRIVTKRAVDELSRIRRLESISVTEADDAGTTVEVQLTVITNTDERGEFVFTV